MTTERQTVALSPTFHTNVPLPCALLYSASLILSLKTNCFHLCIPAPSPTSTSPLGPPISKVSLTGHVVYAKRVKHLELVLDDGTGHLIDCTVFGNVLVEKDFLEDLGIPIKLEPVVGDLVTLSGKLKLVNFDRLSYDENATRVPGSAFKKEILVHSIKIHDAAQTPNIEAESKLRRLDLLTSAYTTENFNTFMSKFFELDNFGTAVSTTKLAAPKKKHNNTRGKRACTKCKSPTQIDYAARLGNYCNCNMSPVDGDYDDEDFVFRNFLLKCWCEQEDSIPIQDNSVFLSFTYGETYNDSKLENIVTTVFDTYTNKNASKSKNKLSKNIFKKLLFQKTFKSLVLDSVIELDDEKTDRYLFMSARTRGENAININSDDEEGWWKDE